MKSITMIRNIAMAAAVLMAAGLWYSPVSAEEKTAYVQPPIRLNAVLVVPDGQMEGKGYKIDAVALLLLTFWNRSPRSQLPNITSSPRLTLVLQLKTREVELAGFAP